MNSSKSLIFAHIAVILFGFTALMTDLSQLSAELIVLGRTAFAAPILFLFVKHTLFFARLRAATVRQKILLPCTALLLCAHWICFFKSIDHGSAAIALLTLACAPVFIILLNLIAGIQKSLIKDGLTCMIILAGVFIMVPKTSGANMLPWILGLASAMLVAGLGFCNKMLVTEFKPIEISMVQTGLCVPILLLFVPLASLNDLNTTQWLYVAGCGIFCTALAQSLFLQAMKHLSALSASFIVNLEPVYGILLALVILGDSIPSNQWIGGSIVFSGVLFSSIPQLK